MARRERSLRASVLKVTRWTFHVSNAYVSIKSLASVLAPVRCADADNHVPPISNTLGTGRFLPVVDVHESRRTDDALTLHSDERIGASGHLVIECRRHVRRHGIELIRHQGEGVGGTVFGGRGHQRRNVFEGQRLEPHRLPLEHDGIHVHQIGARSAVWPPSPVGSVHLAGRVTRHSGIGPENRCEEEEQERVEVVPTNHP